MSFFPLSIKFIAIQNKFSYRLVFEISLVITLVISISGIINGVSGQFVTLLTQTNTNPGSYLLLEQNMTYEKSNIPIEVIERIDVTYLDFFTPIVLSKANLTIDYDLSYYHANVSSMINTKDDFYIIEGAVPLTENDILIGEGLMLQMDPEMTFPNHISLIFGDTLIKKQIVGVFKDSSPFYYGFLSEISYDWYNLTYVSAYQFHIKNNLVFPDFKEKLYEIISDSKYNFEISIISLRKSDDLSIAFFEDLRSLFDNLQFLLLILLILKVTHSSFTLFNRYSQEFWVLRTLGMSERNLQLLFYMVLAIIGNIGLAYGIVIGITLPQIILLLFRMIAQYDGLYIIVPSMNDLLFVVILSNIVFALNSFWTRRITMEIKQVS